MYSEWVVETIDGYQEVRIECLFPRSFEITAYKD